MANGHCADCRWEVWSEVSRTHCRKAQQVASFLGKSENGILSPWSLDDCMGWKYWCPRLRDQDIPAPERQTAGYRPSLDICHRCHHACCHWCSGTLPNTLPSFPTVREQLRNEAEDARMGQTSSVLASSPWGKIGKICFSLISLPSCFLRKTSFFCKLILDEFLSCICCIVSLVRPLPRRKKNPQFWHFKRCSFNISFLVRKKSMKTSSESTESGLLSCSASRKKRCTSWVLSEFKYTSTFKRVPTKPPTKMIELV